MISPHTPPGTKVVCTDKCDPNSPLVKHHVYTVVTFVPSIKRPGGFAVQLEELDHSKYMPSGIPAVGFNPARFKLAVLPKCLTDLLTTTKILESV